MTTTPVHFQPQLEHLRHQISELVQQYADLVYAPTPFRPDHSPVPVSGKLIGSGELKMMVDASLDGWLTTGRFNAQFEQQLAHFIGVKHLITVNTG
jgi:CDP-6-deoxy-D-xylo-4-hexulose-3-dehydrase